MDKKNLLNGIYNEINSFGFKKKGSSFNRRNGQYIDIIHIQGSQWSDDVTANLSIMETDIEWAVWGRADDLSFKGRGGAVQLRIGELYEGKLDKWWSLVDPSACDDMIKCLKRDAVDFFDSMHSLEAIQDWLESFPVFQGAFPLAPIYYAAVLWKAGNKRESCIQIRYIIKNSPAQLLRERAMEVAQRIGCDDL